MNGWNMQGQLEGISLEGFIPVSFAKQETWSIPRLTIYEEKFLFTRATHMALEDCQCIKIMVNYRSRMVLISPCSSSDPEGVVWKNNSKQGGRNDFTCREITGRIFAEWGWNAKQKYVSHGRLVNVQGKVMLLFDFRNPYVLEKNKGGRTVGVRMR